MDDEVWLPRVHTPVADDADLSEGQLAIDLAEFAWNKEMTLDPWQKWLLKMILAKDPKTGKFLHNQSVVSVGRQNGKTQMLTALTLHHMLTRKNANMFSLASNLEQARISYQRTLTTIYQNKELRKRFKKATETRGITSADGASHYTCQPSKGSALQGHSLSLVLCDELHIMSPDVWSAVVVGAGQQKDSMVVGITTAGSEESQLLLDLYERGKANTPGMFFALWEAPRGSKIDDLEALKAANPALACGRMDPEQILREVALLPEQDARRYRLNTFTASTSTWLPPSAWAQCAVLTDELLEDRRDIVLSVDRSPEWSGASVVATWKQEDGLIATDLLASVVRPSLDDLADLVSEIAQQVPHKKIVMDGHGLAELHDRLKQRGFNSEKLTLRDWIIGSGIAYSKITEDEVMHPHHPLLDLQMPRAIRKDTGDKWRVVRTSTAVEIDAVMATIAGIYAAETDRDAGVQIF